MNQNYIPACYFPSTVMFVDDSRDFLLNFTLQLNEDLAFRLHDSPYNALKTMQALKQSDQLSQRCLTEYLDADGCPITNHTVNLDLSAIQWEVYNPRRFGEIAVVVVDYAMPGMSGLEFCQRMGDSPIKRILLTGRADEKTAVQAFNDGIINLYIQKQNPDITHAINDSIAKMQMAYFQSMSEIIIRMLSVNSPNCLQDAKFADLFNEIITQNEIVEYYLTEDSGSFLLLNAQAEPSCLIVKNEQDLKLHYELASDSQAPEKVLEALKSGEKIPCFIRPEHYLETEKNDWNAHLQPADKLESGDEVYYYTYIKQPIAAEIQPEKIHSYNDYLDELDTNVA